MNNYKNQVVNKTFFKKVLLTTYFLFAVNTLSAKTSNKTIITYQLEELSTLITPQFNQDSIKTKNLDPVYTSVEFLPSFPGGLRGFQSFVTENLNYPVKAKKRGIKGPVFLSFIIEKDGSLSNIRIVRGIGGGWDEEAIRILELSPKWKPGVQNKKEVRVDYTIPIVFQLPK